MAIQSITIAGVRVDNVTAENTILLVANKLSSKTYSATIFPIVTINPEFIVQANNDRRFKTVLGQAFLAVPDGIGILLVSLLQGKQLSGRVTGVQLVKLLTKFAEKETKTIGFIGGKKGSAKKVLENYKILYPNLSAWACEGPVLTIQRGQHSEARENRYFTQKSLNNIKRFFKQQPEIPLEGKVGNTVLEHLEKTDILFVAFGAPKQEFFIRHLKGCLASKRARIAVGIGGSLDELSGIVSRSPKWIERIGLKWLFRLISQPWRWRRQMRLLQFIFLAFAKNTREHREHL